MSKKILVNSIVDLIVKQGVKRLWPKKYIDKSTNSGRYYIKPQKNFNYLSEPNEKEKEILSVLNEYCKVNYVNDLLDVDFSKIQQKLENKRIYLHNVSEYASKILFPKSIITPENEAEYLLVDRNYIPAYNESESKLFNKVINAGDLHTIYAIEFENGDKITITNESFKDKLLFLNKNPKNCDTSSTHDYSSVLKELCADGELYLKIQNEDILNKVDPKYIVTGESLITEDILNYCDLSSVFRIYPNVDYENNLREIFKGFLDFSNEKLSGYYIKISTKNIDSIQMINVLTTKHEGYYIEDLEILSEFFKPTMTDLSFEDLEMMSKMTPTVVTSQLNRSSIFPATLFKELLDGIDFKEEHYQNRRASYLVADMIKILVNRFYDLKLEEVVKYLHKDGKRAYVGTDWEKLKKEYGCNPDLTFKNRHEYLNNLAKKIYLNYKNT